MKRGNGIMGIIGSHFGKPTTLRTRTRVVSMAQQCGYYVVKSFQLAALLIWIRLGEKLISIFPP